MTKPTEATNGLDLELGMPVDSTDHHWGVLDDIVIDPVQLKVTHLVVQPRHRHHKARLIPVDTVASADNRLQLMLSTEEVLAAPKVETTDFITHPGDDLGYQNPLMWPYYPSLAGAYGGIAYGYGYGRGVGYGSGSPIVTTTTYDKVPTGTVEIRRNSEVITSDHHVVGHVDGFVTDHDGAITHLVLAHGHLWGHREITIPLDDIRHASSDSVRLSITHDAVADCPSVRFKRQR